MVSGINDRSIKLLGHLLDSSEKAGEKGVTPTYLSTQFGLDKKLLFEDLTFWVVHGVVERKTEAHNTLICNYFKLASVGEFIASRNAIIDAKDVETKKSLMNKLVGRFPRITQYWDKGPFNSGKFRYDCFAASLDSIYYNVQVLDNLPLNIVSVSIRLRMPNYVGSFLFESGYSIFTKEITEHTKFREIDLIKVGLHFLSLETKRKGIEYINVETMKKLNEDIISFVEYAFYQYAFYYLESSLHLMQGIKNSSENIKYVKETILGLAKELAHLFGHEQNSYIRNPQEYIYKTTSIYQKHLGNMIKNDLDLKRELKNTGEELAKCKRRPAEFIKVGLI